MHWLWNSGLCIPLLFWIWQYLKFDRLVDFFFSQVNRNVHQRLNTVNSLFQSLIGYKLNLMYEIAFNLTTDKYQLPPVICHWILAIHQITFWVNSLLDVQCRNKITSFFASCMHHSHHLQMMGMVETKWGWMESSLPHSVFLFFLCD